MKKFYFVSFIVTALLSVAAYFVIAFTAEGRLMRQNAEALSGDVVAWGKCEGSQYKCMKYCENCGQTIAAFVTPDSPDIRPGTAVVVECPTCGSSFTE